MSDEPDGGYAFPLPISVGPSGDVYHAAAWAEGGMTLRDYFAAKALTGILAFPGDEAGGNWHNNSTSEGVARRSYELADAMLAERAK